MGDPLDWYFIRATGFVLLVLLTLSVTLGVLATRGSAQGSRVPRFVTQSLHRNVSLLTMSILAAHAVTAVIDHSVDIRWWHALVPLGGSFEPVSLALGTVALDLLLVVVITSLLRHRMSHGPWRILHAMTYAAWAAAMVHGFTLGTDSGQLWARIIFVVCGVVVIAAVSVRVADLVRQMSGPRSKPTDSWFKEVSP